MSVLHQCEIVRYKEWLVAKDLFKWPIVNFNETFAPMAKFMTIKCICGIGMAMDWEIHQMDIK